MANGKEKKEGKRIEERIEEKKEEGFSKLMRKGKRLLAEGILASSLILSPMKSYGYHFYAELNVPYKPVVKYAKELYKDRQEEMKDIVNLVTLAMGEDAYDDWKAIGYAGRDKGVESVLIDEITKLIGRIRKNKGSKSILYLGGCHKKINR